MRDEDADEEGALCSRGGRPEAEDAAAEAMPISKDAHLR
jgi:hypothetical protein